MADHDHGSSPIHIDRVSMDVLVRSGDGTGMPPGRR